MKQICKSSLVQTEASTEVEFWRGRVLVFHASLGLLHNSSMGKASTRCFCAFCRSERIVYRKRHISAVDLLLSVVVSLLLSFIVFQDFDPRLVVFFAGSVVISEAFVLVRWRFSIACQRCGFDPVLYRKKPELAAQRVKAFYGERMEDPMSIFSPPPKLPVLIRKKA